MLLNEEQVLRIVRELWIPTLNKKIRWHGGSGKVWIDLPNDVTVELSERSDLSLTANVKRGEEVLGAVQLDPNEKNGHAAESRQLYEVAVKEASEGIFAEILDTIKIFGEPPPLPPLRASPEKAAEVLKKMAGKWHLDYSRGKETAEIRQDGSYFIAGKKEPVFRLVVLASNDSTGAVEVAKDKPDGRRYQIEYLTITPDSMKGHAKHDLHDLTYTRAKM